MSGLQSGYEPLTSREHIVRMSHAETYVGQQQKARYQHPRFHKPVGV